MTQGTKNWDEGNFVRIPLEGGMFGFGRVLRGAVGFYDLRAAETPPLEEIAARPMLFKVWVMKYAIGRKYWQVVGNLPLTPELLIPWTFYGFDTISGEFWLYHQETAPLQIPATIDEVRGFESAGVWDPEHIEQRLNDHFAGRENIWAKMGTTDWKLEAYHKRLRANEARRLEQEAALAAAPSKTGKAKSPKPTHDHTPKGMEPAAGGFGFFDSDDAADFLAELRDSEAVSIIKDALDAVTKSGDDYLEAPDAGRAIGACGVLAAMIGKGNPQKDFSNELADWLAKQKRPTKKLLKLAAAAIDRILADESELKELWTEGDGFNSWERNLKNLRADLVAGAEGG